MLEIFAIIYLSKKNGALAETKGLKFGKWVLYSVLAWFGFEIVGAIIGIIIFGQTNIVAAYLLAIASAILSYFVVKNFLQNKPNSIDDDINQIGISDLYPNKNNNPI